MTETRLFVRNIPLDTTEQELQSEFGYYGVVRSVELKRKDDENLFGFVNIVIEERLIEKCE
jgi:RNA recognition motif-containing protein